MGVKHERKLTMCQFVKTRCTFKSAQHYCKHSQRVCMNAYMLISTSAARVEVNLMAADGPRLQSDGVFHWHLQTLLSAPSHQLLDFYQHIAAVEWH